ncbi:hypothetical protein DSL72_004679 [Monilinia vaccinii-corymbosi]|uniref:Glucose-methanol-choline oxidoreductase N-terminal domain-containing protein n=1 Tax=Monilinia vaccinii-corymbosi TaxID=61207 RepID=A0A8A3P8Z9_9HELO|nr:hypothetical protein DSL72_004679 [Monilinia vaccinii-corymbosi]
MIPKSHDPYDFIIVGGGPAGLSLAARLSSARSHPSVLLIEAGGQNSDEEYFIPADRFSLFTSQPSLNWGYKTEPCQHLRGQQLDYSRGKGIGGSTAINFSCWVLGGAEDFDAWAEQVGDDTWSWSKVQERFKKIEHYHDEIPDAYREFVNPNPEDHGKDGPLHVSYAPVWERDVADVFIAAKQAGLPLNTDMNSGNPIGVGMGPSTMHAGLRVTASSYLPLMGPRFETLLNAPVAKVLFDGKRAKGIRTIDGREYYARKDVILSAGAISTPQILMLSGIGPASELQKHDIPIIKDLPHVGRNLQDHPFTTVSLLLKEGSNDRMTLATNEEMMKLAKEAWIKDKSGKLSELYCGVPMGWLRDDRILQSKEFNQLDEELKKFMRQKNVPSFEIATVWLPLPHLSSHGVVVHCPPLYTGTYTLVPTDSYLTCLCFIMNPQATGSVTLRSSNPSDHPIIDAHLADHPYDRRVLIEGARKTMEFLDTPVFREKTVKMIGAPEGGVNATDEEIWEHCRNNLFSCWHMCSTVRMGKGKDDRKACVDVDFRVLGVEGLRVVDLSVIPRVPNTATQSTAYLVGETAAEKMINEYALNEVSSGDVKANL